ncbi:MAG TPA: S8 family serine peptidase, partial [Chitinophagaceae bacterium]|nr:S8 family serine peptidase [Chitinophagaceae bacterium]
TLAAGLNHVAKYGALGDVVNLSLGAYSPAGCPHTSYPVGTAIQALANEGVFVCMSAGNDGGYASSNYPGCIDGTRIITVGALNCNNSLAGYSNYGAGVDFVAVGTNVYSCWKNGEYRTLSGTSMATPVVSGILISRGWPVSGPMVNCNGTMTPIATR